MNTTTNEALLKKIDEAPLLMSKEAAKKNCVSREAYTAIRYFLCWR
ncbi:MAG: hypothetical protein ACLTZI_06740 [[Eubacterium] siraeum]